MISITIILAVVVGNGILLIMILTALQIQDRKKEMGIFSMALS